MKNSGLVLTLRRTFDASCERVFDALTNTASTVGFWGPAGFTLAFHEIDLRPGGKWRLGMRKADGELHVSTGTYREIIAPTRIVMTHGWEDENGTVASETLVSITFTEREGKTDMLFEQRGFESAPTRSGHDRGWTEAFDGACRVHRGEPVTSIVCRCGGVRAELDGPHVAQFYCHCDDCQAVHGAAYVSIALYPAAAVRVVAGEVVEFIHRTMPRDRCAACATQLFGKVVGQPLVGVKANLLPVGEFAPAFHVRAYRAAPAGDWRGVFRSVR